MREREILSNQTVDVLLLPSGDWGRSLSLQGLEKLGSSSQLCELRWLEYLRAARV